MKFIPDRAPVHIQERLWRRDLSDAAKLCRVDLSKVDRHISDRCSYSTGSFSAATKFIRIGPLFTHKNSYGSAISVIQRSCVSAISKAESHISDSCTHYSGQLFVAPRTSVRYREYIASRLQNCDVYQSSPILLFLCIETEVEKLYCDN